MRVLVTRPEPGAGDTARVLAAAGIETVVAPLLEARWLTPALPEAASIDAIVLTSANGVRGLMALEGAPALRAHTVFAVGDRTAAAARAAGFTDIRSAAGAFDDLVELISAEMVHGTLLHARGQHAAGDLAAALSADGIGIIEAIVYEMDAPPALPEAARLSLTAGELQAVLLYSRRTAEVFAALTRGLPEVTKRQVALICLSEQVATPVREAGYGRIAIAHSPNEAAMVGLASSFADGENPA